MVYIKEQGKFQAIIIIDILRIYIYIQYIYIYIYICMYVDAIINNNYWCRVLATLLIWFEFIQ